MAVDALNEAGPGGPCVLVTRPAAQASGWVSKLHARGCAARALPLLAISPPADAGPLQDLWRGLQPGALLMFVSPNAAAQGLAALKAPWHWPAGVTAAATGPGTVAALRAAGVPANAIVAPPDDAPQFDSEALWQRLRHQDWRGRPVWVLRGEGGRDWFAETLRAAGAEVGFVQAYRRHAPQLSAAEQALLAQVLAQPRSFCWLFSSSEAVDHLQALAPEADWAAASAIATHPRIAERARALGVGQVLQASPGVEAVLAARARLG